MRTLRGTPFFENDRTMPTRSRPSFTDPSDSAARKTVPTASIRTGLGSSALAPFAPMQNTRTKARSSDRPIAIVSSSGPATRCQFNIIDRSSTRQIDARQLRRADRASSRVIGKSVDLRTVSVERVEGKGVEGERVEGERVEGERVEGEGVEGKGVERERVEGEGVVGETCAGRRDADDECGQYCGGRGNVTGLHSFWSPDKDLRGHQYRSGQHQKRCGDRGS